MHIHVLYANSFCTLSVYHTCTSDLSSQLECPVGNYSEGVSNSPCEPCPATVSLLRLEWLSVHVTWSTTEHLMKVPVWPAHVRILNCAEQTSPVIVLDLFVEEL